MRRSLWVIFALMVAIVAPNARADSFTYTYTDPIDGLSWTTVPIPATTTETTLPIADLTASSTSGIYAGCAIASVILNFGDFGNQEAAFSGCLYPGVITEDFFLLSDYSNPGTYTGLSNRGTLLVTAIPTT